MRTQATRNSRVRLPIAVATHIAPPQVHQLLSLNAQPSQFANAVVIYGASASDLSFHAINQFGDRISKHQHRLCY